MVNLVEIVVTGKNLSRPAMDEATAGAKGLGGVMDQMGKVSTLALVGIGAASIDMATKYESSTTRLVTSANETTKNLGMVRQGMLDMAGQVGISAEDLSKGMYTVESAGFHAADALTVLKASAQGAKDENADLGTVANGVTDVLVDYHDKASDAANVTSQLVTAVSFGKTNFQDFSGALSNILPTAAAVHLKLADVSGVLAEMTAHGMSADRASQDEANAMRSLVAPTGAMEKEFKLLGISTDEVHQKLGTDGLAGTMQWLSQVAQQGAPKIGQDYTEAMKKLMGTAPGLVTALMTTGENANATQQAIAGIAGASADAQGNVKGFSEVQKTLGQQTAQLKAGLDSLMIELGQKLIPVLTTTVGWFVKHQGATKDLIMAIGAFLTVMASYAIAARAAALATTLWAVATGELDVAEMANPIGLIIAAIVALGIAIYELVKHWKTVWGDIKKWAEDAWHFIYDGFGKYLLPLLGPVGLLALGAIELSKHWKQVWGDIKQVASDFYQWIWNDFGKKIADFFTQTIPHWFDTAVRDVKGAWNAVYDAIFAPIKHAYDDVVGFLDNLINTIESLPGKAADAAGKAASSLMHAGGNWNPLNWFAHGGIVGAATGGARGNLTMVGERGPELVRLPLGSTVNSNSDTQAMLSQMGGNGSVKVQLEVVSGGASEFEQFMMTAIRNWVRVRYGSDPNSVQKALGFNF